jgi:hypothetical protein
MAKIPGLKTLAKRAQSVRGATDYDEIYNYLTLDGEPGDVSPEIEKKIERWSLAAAALAKYGDKGKVAKMLIKRFDVSLAMAYVYIDRGCRLWGDVKKINIQFQQIALYEKMVDLERRVKADQHLDPGEKYDFEIRIQALQNATLQKMDEVAEIEKDLVQNNIQINIYADPAALGFKPVADIDNLLHIFKAKQNDGNQPG